MESQAPRHVLVFEADARGHTEEWLVHIARFMRDRRPPLRVTLAVPQVLAPRLRDIATEDPAADLEILALDERACRPCIARPLARAAFARWRLMKRCIRVTGADHGLFLCLDAVSLPLALGGAMAGRSISGVLFRPSVHYAAFHTGEPRLPEIVRDLRKRIMYPPMLRNPALETVLSLDPYFVGYARRTYRDGGKIVELPDPAAIPTPVPSPGEHAALRFPEHRHAFLLFGELTARKGILELLQACQQLDGATAACMALIVAGRIAPELRAEVGHRVRELGRHRPELWIQVADRRLAESEIAQTLMACDVLLAPYQRFVGSSGLLVWAATFGRPVITQDYGMLGQAVRDYGLGLAVDTTRPAEIAAALRRVIDGNGQKLFDPEGARRFALHRDGELFAQRVLGLDHSDVAAPYTERSPEMLHRITA
jgi:glycosyltransferase involved in cell wall biosynthesis